MTLAFRFRKSFIFDKDTSAGKGARFASPFSVIFSPNVLATIVLVELPTHNCSTFLVGWETSHRSFSSPPLTRTPSHPSVSPTGRVKPRAHKALHF